MEILLAKTPFMALMEGECFQTSASRSNLLVRQEEIAMVVIAEIVTVSLVVTGTVINVVIATVTRAVANVAVWREEEEEDHLPETSASGAATRVIGKNFITNYEWMEKDEIDGVDLQRSERELWRAKDDWILILMKRGDKEWRHHGERISSK